MKSKFTFMLLLFCMISIAQDKIYVHTATTDNSSGNITYINHPDLNGNPGAGIVYVHTWNANGLPSVYNNNVTGLWYNSGRNQWAIYNEIDTEPIVNGSHYMVYIADDPTNVITHVSNAGNQGSFGPATTVIDNPLMNGLDPGPFAIMSHYYNPNNTYNDQNFGFYYDTALDKRGIYDENAGPAIPDGAAFKILIRGEGVDRFTHTATTGNISGHTSLIDHPLLNDNPNATFVFSHYWGVAGVDSQQDLDAVVSVYYASGFWRFYCEDQSTPMPANIVFDIIVAPQDVLSVEDNEALSYQVYPNPATNMINVEVGNTAIVTATLYNILGQEVANFKGNETHLQQLDISGQASGNYILKVTTKSASQSFKIIKN